MAYSASTDMAAAWHAVAPPPPPTPSKTPSSVRSYTSSPSASSLGFDSRTKGDDLPLDSHAPEPERPVSRNAVAKAREKERQRARTNSTSVYSSASPVHQPSSPFSEAGYYHHATTATRERHDSSPATSAPWSMYPQQTGYQYAPTPPSVQVVPVVPCNYYSQPPPQAYTQVGGWPPHSVVHPVHGAPQPSLVSADWSPMTSAPVTVASSPVSYAPYYPAPAPTPGPSAPHHGVWGAGQTAAQYNVPFPTNTSMPPPPLPSGQPVTRTSVQVGSRPLPSPSRSSSQSSSVGTNSSSPSLASISGTVRRSLPQPPSKQLTRMASVDSPLLGRSDSVRMAAEEIMSRGPPRRKNMSAGSRFAPIKTISMSGGSTSGASNSSTSSIVEPKSPIRVARAESSSCLEKELREVKLNEERWYSTTSNVQAPQREIVRAVSPRPIRAAPEPAPEVAISAPVSESIPDRPRSRGPKDERDVRQRRTSMVGYETIPVEIPVIFSPPPDVKPPIPILSLDESPVFVQLGMPSIVLPGDDVPAIQIDDNMPFIQVESPPAIEIESPTINVTSEDSEESEDGEGPKASISISVSSSNIAQRSTTSTNIAAACAHDHGHDSHRHLARQPAAPASASSVGSGASCATCQKWIGGRVVHAMSLTFHPDCFVCCHCSEHLEHVAFYEHEGRPYCHFDYHELFSKRCFHCRTPIVDQRYITINDVDLVGGNAEERCYHDLHFFCANCGDPFLDPKVASSAAGSDPMEMIEDEDGKVSFGGREFVVHKGYPYCEKCHVNLHKPRCKGCKKPIIETDFLTALKAKWHLDCFCCQICQNPISSENFFVKDGQAFDEECYKIKLRSEL